MNFLLVATLLTQTLAAPIALPPRTAPVKPEVVSTRYIANVTDPTLSRDSCGSSRVGNRAFWTCRDTTSYDVQANILTDSLVTNSASWTNAAMFGPDISATGPVGVGSTGSNPILQMYGGVSNVLRELFPVPQNECGGNGICKDATQTRWAIWPDLPPVITEDQGDGNAVGYTWIPQAHLEGLTPLIAEPAYALYKTTFAPGPLDANALPTATVVNAAFWGEGEVGFGNYGTVNKDGILYLYGQTSDKGTVLAQVPTASVENRAAYQFYNHADGSWSSTAPGINDTSPVIPNAGGGGQGTFYYSSHFGSYLWIGQMGISGSADFYLSTAPAPEGPWIEPYLIFKGKNGDSDIAGGYSLQAHPALLPSGMEASESAIYITWTQDWNPKTYAAGYTTPLVYVQFR